jgi:GntR family transcriptional repressor for pyruvate dehydrogenase complex
MKKPVKDQKASVIRRAVQSLRDEALSTQEGAMLGSEDELLERHNVSRPTLRQAAALVAQEQLLTIRRGVGGGYMARRPTSRAVAHMASVFLRSRGVGLEQIIRAVEPIRVELARLATRKADDAARASLGAFLVAEDERDRTLSAYKAFLIGEREFGELLGQISGNQVLSLFLDILYDLASYLRSDQDLYKDHPERIAEYKDKRNRLAEAIMCGDEELAVMSARRCASLGAEWMMQQLRASEAAESTATAAAE